MLTYAHHLLDTFFLGVIPWWFYVVASVTAAIIIIIELPNRLGLVLGLLAALILGDIGFTAKGYQLGHAADRAEWDASRAAEKQRLADGFAAQLALETARADLAETQTANLRKERQDAIDAAPGAPGDPIVIPAVVAAKLYLIGRSQGRPDSAAKRSRGPLKISPMLLLHHQAPGTG